MEEQKKYIFTKIDEDTTILKYKSKSFEFKKDVELLSKMQDANNRATTKLALELTKQGITKQDLTVVRKTGSKTFYDNSNYQMLLEQYTSMAMQEIYDEICIKYTNMDLTTLMQDIGLDITTANKEVEQFGLDLTTALSGKKTPSKA